jgi:endoglucanase Acf2
MCSAVIDYRPLQFSSFMQSSQTDQYCDVQALSKFATIVYTIHDIMKDSALANAGLTRLKDAFAVFVENRQKYPLVYECEQLNYLSLCMPN